MDDVERAQLVHQTLDACIAAVEAVGDHWFKEGRVAFAELPAAIRALRDTPMGPMGRAIGSIGPIEKPIGPIDLGQKMDVLPGHADITDNPLGSPKVKDPVLGPPPGPSAVAAPLTRGEYRRATERLSPTPRAPEDDPDTLTSSTASMATSKEALDEARAEERETCARIVENAGLPNLAAILRAKGFPP